MKTQLMKIRCLTNLHVGSGDVDFGIIDGQVEKDPINAKPVIFSSGVKGALREYAKDYLENGKIENIFGVERSDNDKKQGKAGNVRFLTAYLVAIPVRASMGVQSYYMVTTKNILLQFFQMQRDIENKESRCIQDIKELDSDKNYYLNREKGGIGVEGYEAEYEIPQELKQLRKFLEQHLESEFSKNVIILSEENMKEIDLPVVARNHLENGKSVNLWYEEIVPHESIFFMYMLSNGTPTGDESLDELLELIKEKPLIQFGGNMTIGNGFTIVERWEFNE